MWSFVETNAVNDCPAAVTYPFVTQGAIGFLQTGTQVVACGDGIPYARGELRQAVISADASLSGNLPFSVVSFHLSSVLPDTAGHAVADLRFDFAAGSMPVAGLPCSRTSVISIDQPPRLPCSEHDDCLRQNPCLRCVNGACVRNSRCGRP
jgi:hypothetical protein